ncbi:MAG: valine--tRNA ligase [Bacteroidota bacterium]
MEIAKTYSPSATENKWYKYWMEKGYFRSVPDDREPYTIVIPPPNVTGVLHMGHMLNNTIQDVMIRRARLLGKNACWVPGTDHASIATEAKVVHMLREMGIKKSDLSREEFLKYAWQWKEKYGGIILEQLKKLGASCDWERTSFTMDDGYYRDVVNVFIDLYNKGFIYRGKRMVNWDPAAKTALSDEEVLFKETRSKLVYVKYIYEEGNGYLTVATVRPETIMGDVAVAVHPDDDRYKHLHGKNVIVPLVNRAVPVITDEAIDMEFGTGCLKVTPAHDIVDYEIGLRHNLPVIDTLNEDGTISKEGQVFVGLDRFVARKMAIKQLEEEGLIEKSEDYTHQVGHSERTNAVIEPRLSMQWYLKMKDISKPALDAVVNGEVNLIPSKFVNTYKHWMENVRDWCLSRQLWWGHRIPAWYNADGEFEVCATVDEAVVKFKSRNINVTAAELKQEEDVMDTWASSWLWPISVFDGFANPDNADIKYYYPTNDLVTAPEILFFWVARMIIAGYEYKGEKPFTNVYLTGIVRDKQGRKMSKSLGNSPDPLDLIEKYGADGVRMGMLLCSPAGNDLPFDESFCEQGRNFSNKIWNSFRLIQGWKVDYEAEQPETRKKAITWLENRIAEQLAVINDHFSKYRISDALMASYKLVWDDYCAWYLEAIKPEFINGESLPIDAATYNASCAFFEQLLTILHPFMPFITEELWHAVKERKEGDDIIITSWPKTDKYDKDLLAQFELCKSLISEIRNYRQQKNISPKQPLQLYIMEPAKNTVHPGDFNSIIKRLANISVLQYILEPPANCSAFLVDSLECFIPYGDTVDKDAERERLQKELEYAEGFLKSVMNKLGNEKFISNAKPEIIASETKKRIDAESKIDAIKSALSSL